MLFIGSKISFKDRSKINIPNNYMKHGFSFLSYTANVEPMETTYFVCVQNPALDYLYFLKNNTADFILKNL